jgi:phenylpropionate dioxygenase-like ring-hydroxylating dioxygenase large terminal subunit
MSIVEGRSPRASDARADAPARIDSGVKAPGRPLDYSTLVSGDRIHGSLYTDPRVFEEELRKIFYGGWVYVGHESEIPAAGDYVCRAIGLEPVIFLRDREGEPRVYSNRCTHRGNMLCRSEKGSAKLLKCDYHGWTFSLDGKLMAVPFAEGFCGDMDGRALGGPSRVASYRGFVFATFNRDSVALEEHLGAGADLIDRAVRISPLSRIRLTAGWIKHRFACNWKMLPENATDGYHASVTHASFFETFRATQYDAHLGRESARLSLARDWGRGHTELDFRGRYTKPLEWLGMKEERAAGYVAAMLGAHGDEAGRRILTEGPPHATIFPNLFLGELNIVMFQPLSANECVQWHTPMLLEGVEENLNVRIVRQSEGAMGPSGFLLADDGVISERSQAALQGRSGWLDLSRGLNREGMEDGALTSFSTDEVNNRGFWRHYRAVMEAT